MKRRVSFILMFTAMLSLAAGLLFVTTATIYYAPPKFTSNGFACELPTTLKTASAGVPGHPEIQNGWYVLEGSAYIVAYTGDAQEVVIPDYVYYPGDFSNGEYPAKAGDYPVRYIGARAFAGAAVTAVTIPAATVQWSADAFADCPTLAVIRVASSGTAAARYAAADGVLFTADGRDLLVCPAAHGATYTVPASTLVIARGAFHPGTLRTLTVPVTVRQMTDALSRFDDPASLTVRCVDGSVAHTEAVRQGCTVELMPGQLWDIAPDGRIDSSDARVILQYEVGLLTLSPARAALGDVNGDSATDSSDARLVLQREVGLI